MDELKISNPPNDLDVIKVARKLSVKLENATRWEEFGMNLLHTSDNHAVLSIDPASEKSLTDKCKDLLNFWKGNSNDPKWEEVIEALRNMDGLRNFATMLENALKGTGTSTNSHALVTPLVNPSYQNLLPFIEHVDDWKSLGTYLLPAEFTPRLLNDIERTHRDRVDECRGALLRDYFRVGDVSWSKVIDSLEKSHHPNVVKMIKQQIYKS